MFLFKLLFDVYISLTFVPLIINCTSNTFYNYNIYNRNYFSQEFYGRDDTLYQATWTKYVNFYLFKY